MQKLFTQELLAKSLDFPAYLQLFQQVVAEGKTTGPKQTQSLIDYTKLNFQRTKRLNSKLQLLPEVLSALKNWNKPLLWIVLTETWCGDAAQNLPALARMAEASPAITLRILLRDENPEIMDAYLTNGGRSIPKLIVLDAETLTPLTDWGPRPAPAQRMVMENKAKANPLPSKEFTHLLHQWYHKDGSRTLQQEIVERLSSLENKTPVPNGGTSAR